MLKENDSIPQKVLIVDDQPFNIILLSEVIKMNNYDVYSASNGKNAISIAMEIIPDIILLDIMMPEMDGYEVCELLKKNSLLQQIPVIFISSLNDSKDIVKAFEVGGVDYITKPFQFEEVNARIKTQLTIYNQNKKISALNIALQKHTDHLKNFSAHLQLIREEERLFVANKVHDSIGQVLIAMKIEMGLWKKNIESEINSIVFKKIHSKYTQLVQIVDNTITNVRDIVGQLKSDDLELLGLIETIKLSCSEFQLINNITCVFECSITEILLDEQKKIAVYRILQEALSNIAEHAYCSKVTVKLFKVENRISLEILDNGVGFNQENVNSDKSFGILDMKERAFFLGTILIVKSNINEGTLVKIEFETNEIIDL